MSSAIEIMNLRAPELVPTTTDARALAMINFTRTRINAAGYQDRAEMAVALYTLHLLAKDALGTSVSGGGRITGETEGNLSRSYAHAAVTGSSEDLSSTAFGKEYLSLRAAYIHPFRTSAM